MGRGAGRGEGIGNFRDSILNVNEENNLIIIQLKINKDIFPGRDFKVYEGSFTSAAEAKSGKEITNQICNSDMTKADAGYLINVDDDTEVTMVMFDAKGQVIGCLPFYLYLESIATADINFSFYKKNTGCEA